MYKDNCGFHLYFESGNNYYNLFQQYMLLKQCPKVTENFRLNPFEVLIKIL